MNILTQRAIRHSLLKWRKNAECLDALTDDPWNAGALSGLSLGPLDCLLCELFIKEHTGYDSCEGTPYTECIQAVEEGDYYVASDAAARMVELLESLS